MRKMFSDGEYMHFVQCVNGARAREEGFFRDSLKISFQPGKEVRFQIEDNR